MNAKTHQAPRILELHGQGWQCTPIARETKCSRSNVWQVIKRAGLKPNYKPRQIRVTSKPPKAGTMADRIFTALERGTLTHKEIATREDCERSYVTYVKARYAPTCRIPTANEK